MVSSLPAHAAAALSTDAMLIAVAQVSKQSSTMMKHEQSAGGSAEL
jgi:hypothetical protein